MEQRKPTDAQIYGETAHVMSMRRDVRRRMIDAGWVDSATRRVTEEGRRAVGRGTYVSFSQHGVPTPLGKWDYVLDDYGITYGPGWWPFHRSHSGPCIVRLAPDTEFRSWSNEYVLVYPQDRLPYLAVGHLNLFIARQGGGVLLAHVAVEFDIRARTFRLLPSATGEQCPPPLRKQAEVKAAKIMRLVLAARLERRRGVQRPTTAHDRHNARSEGSN